MPQPKPRTDSGHGHVFPRLDGFVARCGGPSICPECAKDFAQITSLKDQMTAPPKYQSIPTPPARPNGSLPAMSLSKRELIAAMAMQGLCAAITGYNGPSRLLDVEGMAQDAIGAADALLEELAK